MLSIQLVSITELNFHALLFPITFDGGHRNAVCLYIRPSEKWPVGPLLCKTDKEFIVNRKETAAVCGEDSVNVRIYLQPHCQNERSK